jgi:[CysO sulfur-carrier protein]-S-L-cysteine hydrolase
VVTLPQSVYDAMLAHVQSGYPNEACGILAGDAAGERIMKHYPAHNAAADVGDDPATFSIIAGSDLLRIWSEIDDNDWSLLAYYHSHPRTQAYPSPRDVRYANGWPGTYYLIFSLADPAHPVLRAFLVEGDRVIEDTIEIQAE